MSVNESEIIGPVLGPVSSTQEAIRRGGKYINNGVRYDFAIGGLPFKRWSTDEQPYARETGQIRKEQIDQSQQPGDQSLSGMWLRGQLTFHRGEGLKYYEVLSSQDALGRYSTGSGINPWTPGEVRLRQANTKFSNDNYVQGVAAYSFDQSDDTGFMLTNTGQVHEISDTADSISILSDSGGNTDGFKSLTANDLFVWACRGGKVWMYNGSGNFTEHITSSEGVGIQRVWYAKDRLFMVNSAAEWFAVAPYDTSTVAATDAFWQGQPTNDRHNYSLTDTPGGVVAADNNKIYLINIDTSGGTPTLTPPTVAALLPPRERVRGIVFHMGYLVIGTNRGYRVAQMNGDQIIMGPLFDKVIPGRHVDLTPDGSFVTFPGRHEDETEDSYWQFNLAEFTSDLVPAFCRVDTLTGTLAGEIRVRGRTFVYGSDGAWADVPGERQPAGHIYVGFQRFGTLEPKVFDTVSIRALGDDGSIAVTLVRKDGTEQPVTTLAPDKFLDQDIKLSLPGPQEFIGLKIMLLRGTNPNKTPVLQGFQLKALPAPRRQRMIQVPFGCFDRETISGSQRGHNGWGWERLSALEDLERTAGLLAYQDFTTGESRRVYIERVQFQCTTPSSRQTTGFGGTGMLTLRAVD